MYSQPNVASYIKNAIYKSKLLSASVRGLVKNDDNQTLESLLLLLCQKETGNTNYSVSLQNVKTNNNYDSFILFDIQNDLSTALAECLNKQTAKLIGDALSLISSIQKPQPCVVLSKDRFLVEV